MFVFLGFGFIYCVIKWLVLVLLNDDCQMHRNTLNSSHPSHLTHLPFFPHFTICSLWQSLGYLIIYITGRPDIQKQYVMSWLGLHGFPLGVVAFSDSLSTDSSHIKRLYLARLIKEVQGRKWVFEYCRGVCVSFHWSTLFPLFSFGSILVPLTVNLINWKVGMFIWGEDKHIHYSYACGCLGVYCGDIAAWVGVAWGQDWFVYMPASWGIHPIAITHYDA